MISTEEDRISNRLENIALFRKTTRSILALLLGCMPLSTLRRLRRTSLGRLGTSRRFGLGLRLRLGTAMQSGEVDLGDVLVERLALALGDLEFQLGGLAGAVGGLIY